MPGTGMNGHASRVTPVRARVFARMQGHARQLVGFQVIPIDLACDEELVDLDMLVAPRETLRAGGGSEQHDVFARAEVEEPDLAEDPARLATHPAAGRGVDEIGVCLRQQSGGPRYQLSARQ